MIVKFSILVLTLCLFVSCKVNQNTKKENKKDDDESPAVFIYKKNEFLRTQLTEYLRCINVSQMGLPVKSVLEFFQINGNSLVAPNPYLRYFYLFKEEDCNLNNPNNNPNSIGDGHFIYIEEKGTIRLEGDYQEGEDVYYFSYMKPNFHQYNIQPGIIDDADADLVLANLCDEDIEFQSDLNGRSCANEMFYLGFLNEDIEYLNRVIIEYNQVSHYHIFYGPYKVYRSFHNSELIQPDHPLVMSQFKMTGLENYVEVILE